MNPNLNSGGAFDSTTSGTSRFTNSTNGEDSLNSFPLQPQSFSLSPNGDVVVEIGGLPQRVPVDGAQLLREQQAETNEPASKKKPMKKGATLGHHGQSKGKSKWLRGR